MKLSEIKTDEGLDILCEITPYVNNILTDEELIAELKKALNVGENTTRAEIIAFGVKKINRLIPIFLKKRRDDVYEILGVLNGVTADEIAEQGFLETARQIKEIVKDKDLIDFFR